MENSMQEQTQNDKMVPIDTSGEAVEVELNEENQRREQAAIEYAKKVQAENKNLNVISQVTSKERVASDEQSLQSTEQLLKTAYTQAVNEGDAEKQMEAQQRIAQLAIEKERLSLRKRKVEQQEIRKEQPVQEEPWSQPQAKQQARPDPQAQDWAEDNKWL